MLWAIPAALLLGWTTESRAQMMGMDFGGGMWGMGGFRTVPSPTDFLNQHALQNAARAGRPASNHAYAGNPNAYFNRVRDNSFTPRYDVRRQPSGTGRTPAPTSLGQTRPQPPADQVSTTAAVNSAARAIAPLAAFFNADRQLVWPADSPVEGDLKPKRDQSDEASLLVLNEVEQRGRASIALAADARQRLLDYGRPALQQIRETATPSIAEGFHAFLRSLYDSLGATTEIPPPPSTR